MIGLSVTLGEFPSRLFKYSFYICVRSFSLAVFSFALEVLFILLTSFTVCYAIRDWLFCTRFLILLIWPWMYSFCSFWYVLVSSICAFSSFYVLAFNGFLLLHKDTVLRYLVFFLTANDSHGTLHLTLGLVSTYSAAVASMWQLTNFCIRHSGWGEISPEEYQIYFL